MSDLNIGVGMSKEEDSVKAGIEAATIAMEQHGGKPSVLVVFGSPKFDHRKLLSGITSVCGDIQMVGGTTSGEISTSGVSSQSVVIMALSSESLQFTTGIGKDMSNDEMDCGLELVNDLQTKTSIEDAKTLMIFPNGMGGDGVKLIDGIHSILGSGFEIVGGYLADDVQFNSTFQYYNGKVYKDALAGLLICGNGEFRTGIGVRSGFKSIGNRFYCTKSEGNVVSEFDEERALDLYKEFIGEDKYERLPGILLEYPFGLIDEKVSISGREYFQLRCGLFVDKDKGTISLAGSIPEGSAITITTASRRDIIKGAQLAAEQAKDSLLDAKPEVIFAFSCVGRKQVLGRRTHEEVDAVRNVFGEDIPIIGFYTYGEIGPIDKLEEGLSTTKFHNETMVLWVLGSY